MATLGSLVAMEIAQELTTHLGALSLIGGRKINYFQNMRNVWNA
jgi:hypothetical protein